MSNTPEPTREEVALAETILQEYRQTNPVGYLSSINDAAYKISTLTAPLRQRIAELEQQQQFIESIADTIDNALGIAFDETKTPMQRLLPQIEGLVVALKSAKEKGLA